MRVRVGVAVRVIVLIVVVVVYLLRVERSVGDRSRFVVVGRDVLVVGFVVRRVSRGAFVTGFGMGVEASIRAGMADVTGEGGVAVGARVRSFG